MDGLLGHAPQDDETSTESDDWITVGGPEEDPLQEENLCIICWISPVDTMNPSCRHAVSCEPCMQQLLSRKGKCPLCRSPIQNYDRGPFADYYVAVEAPELLMPDVAPAPAAEAGQVNNAPAAEAERDEQPRRSGGALTFAEDEMDAAARD